MAHSCLLLSSWQYFIGLVGQFRLPFLLLKIATYILKLNEKLSSEMKSFQFYRNGLFRPPQATSLAVIISPAAFQQSTQLTNFS